MAYSFQDDVSSAVGGRKKLSFMVDDVRVKMLATENIAFKILPARPEGKCAHDAWVPFRDAASGNFSQWGRFIKVARFVGHRGGSTVDLASVLSFDESAECPVDELMKYVRKSSEWKYLQERKETADGRGESPALGKYLDRLMLMNVLDLSEQHLGAQVGILSTSAWKTLVDQGGLAMQLNTSIPRAMLAQNPMLQWACGDLTDPNDGPVLEMRKENKPGMFAGWKVDYKMAMQKAVARLAVASEVLASRYDICDLESIVLKPSRTETIAKLVRVFNRFNAAGQHEYDLLRELFGNEFAIPQPPAIGGSVSMSLPQHAFQQETVFNPYAGGRTPPAPLPTAVPEPEDAAEQELAQTPAPRASRPAPAPAPSTPAPTPSTPVVPGDVPPKMDANAFLNQLHSTIRA
jgi:hypothetical protein